MALIRTITGQDLKDAMKECGRDYYSIEACNAIVEYYEEFDNVELDPIAIACEWCEESTAHLASQYENIFGETTTIAEFLDKVREYTTVIELGNDRVLYIEF